MKLFITMLTIGMITFVVACTAQTSDGSVSVTNSQDSLEQVMQAQAQATRAAFDLQQKSVRATTIADATRESMVIKAQQTRLIQDASATGTVFAQRVQATATAQAATATAYAQIAQATQVAQYATSTADAQNARATIVSASATTTANAANAQMTRTAADATATVVHANVVVEEEKANWNRNLESGRAIALSIGTVLIVLGLCVLVGWLSVKFANAFNLRVRTVRDANGVPFVLMPADKQGRQAIIAPTRSPGAVVMLTPPGENPLQIKSGAVDEGTTTRDQSIALMIAAGRGQGSTELLEELTASPRVQMIDKPPESLLSPSTRGVIDGQWRQLNDDTNK